MNLTGGVQGINPIDPPFLPFFNILFDSRSGPLAVYLGLFLLAIAVVVARNLQFSRIGRSWMAIREDETAAQMMGVNTVRSKLLAFALGASLAGVAGSFQASYLGATTSDFFEFSTSILVLIMVILGGVGNVWGVIVGAIALTYIDKTFLPYLGQRVQDSPIPLPNPAQYNFLVYGIILLVMMRFRPQGFLPDRQREAELSVIGLAEAEVAMGMPIDIDNVSVAPPGQEETGPDARSRRDDRRGARPVTDTTLNAGHPSSVSTLLTGSDRPGPDLVRVAWRDEEVRRADRRQQRRLRYPARIDRVAHRAERRRQDDVLQHDHRLLRPDRRGDHLRRPAAHDPIEGQGPVEEAARSDGDGDRAYLPEHPAVRRHVRRWTTFGWASTSIWAAIGGIRSCARRRCSARSRPRSPRRWSC